MKLLYKPEIMTFSFTVPEFTQLPPTEGVQKVKGFSRGYHHHNSVRLGIRNENDRGMVFYPYFWIDGELYTIKNKEGKNIIPALHSGLVTPGTIVDARIGYTGISVFAEVDWNGAHGQRSGWVRRYNYLFPIGYTLGSYFEQDGQDYKSLNIDYRITNLKVGR